MEILPEDVRSGSSQIRALNSDVSTQQHQETSPQGHTISPSFYLEDTRAFIKFHSMATSPCLPSLPTPLLPLFPCPQPPAHHSQPLSGHSHGSRAPNGNGIWSCSLTNSPSPPLPLLVTIWLLSLPTNPAAPLPAWGSCCFPLCWRAPNVVPEPVPGKVCTIKFQRKL